MKKKIFYQLSVMLLALIALAINSCEMYEYKDPLDESDNSNKVATTIAGNVMDENNVEVAGALVNVEGTTTTTDNHGNFYFNNIKVSEKRFVIKITKGGYLKGFMGVIPHKENVTYVKLIMLENDPVNSINSSMGGTINLANGGSIILPDNSYVYASSGNPYSGTVNVFTKYLSPGDDNFSFKTPGNDLLGKNSADQTVALISYGMLSVELKDNSGQLLQLAPNSNATLSMPIAASQIATSPSAIPLWHFDEATALWKEEGQATKTGNFYIGTVHHFSWWNCDQGTSPAYIQGKVVDCNGAPVGNIIVTLDGWDMVITDNNGYYYETLPCNFGSFPVQVEAANNPGLPSNSAVLTVPNLSAQQTYTLPDLTVGCPTRLAGTITACGQNFGYSFIYAEWTDGSTCFYSTNGNYNFQVPSSTNISLEFGSSLGNDWKFITSGAPGSTTSLPNVHLCNPQINNLPVQSSFVINGDQHVFELVNIDTAGAYCGAVQSGTDFYISINGKNKSNGETVSISIVLPDTLPGDYPMNAGITLGAGFYSISGPFPGYKVKLQKWEPEPGGQVFGTFEGADTTGSGGGVYILSGDFSVNKAY